MTDSNHFDMRIYLMILTMVISLVIAGGFASSDTISFVCIMLYMIDNSRSEMKKEMAVV